MKKRIKILKEVQSYEIGRAYRVQSSFADKLIARGKASEVKEEKKIPETKEEKFTDKPVITKEPEPVPEVRSFAEFSIKKLSAMLSGFSHQDLADLLKDSRVSAIKLAQEEIKRRAS